MYILRGPLITFPRMGHVTSWIHSTATIPGQIWWQHKGPYEGAEVESLWAHTVVYASF